MMYIDTHAHLYVSEFDADRNEMMQRALNAGVKQVVLPAIDSETTAAMHALKKQFPKNIHLMMGLHPTHVKENVEEELVHVANELEKNNFIAFGEIGMDLYWDKTYQKEQQKAFAQQIDWALAYDLPIVIHCREAFDEIFEVLEGVVNQRLRGIFHCFTGNVAQAQRAIELNMLLGIGGVLTFKNSGLAETISKIPLAHLVLETDAPYLAPMPFRGKRNESAYLPLVAQRLAQVYQVSDEQVAQITTANAQKLFGI
ncbi:MAG: TatD family hydrolase [Flavobacteriaceae bacterium]